MSLRFHEIGEGTHRILNPIDDRRLMLLGEICRLTPAHRLLDLACGKGEMMALWAQRWGISAVGIDLSHVFTAAARDRVSELGIADRVTIIQGDAGAYAAEPGTFDVVSCIGATWIGGGLIGTLNLMRPALKPDGLLLVGEPYWNQMPPPEAYAALGVGPDDFSTLLGTMERFEGVGFELVEMVLADPEGWDRYYASQWWNLDLWLRTHPDDPEYAEGRKFLEQQRWSHLAFGRHYLNWGIFVLRQR